MSIIYALRRDSNEVVCDNLAAGRISMNEFGHLKVDGIESIKNDINILKSCVNNNVLSTNDTDTEKCIKVPESNQYTSSSSNSKGMVVLGVRNENDNILCSNDGFYCPLGTDKHGKLRCNIDNVISISNGDITSMKSKIDMIQPDVGDLKNDLNNLRADIASIKTALDNINSILISVWDNVNNRLRVVSGSP